MAAKHSKWHNIKHQKQKADKKRAKKFAKLAKKIVVAAREGGGDPEFNFRLRMAIDNAKAENMPKDNIERAIKRGTGEDSEGELEAVVYEGYGPGDVGLIVKCLTDNRNRTVADVKYTMSQHNGKMGDPGSVQWMFDKKGMASVALSDIGDREAFGLAMIEVGADDLQAEKGVLWVLGPVTKLQNIVDAVEEQGVTPKNTKIAFVPENTIEINEAARKELRILIEALDENDDVEDVFTNLA
jgi:YebC/PmpR family DNA-binding regulatory protein